MWIHSPEACHSSLLLTCPADMKLPNAIVWTAEGEAAANEAAATRDEDEYLLALLDRDE